MQFDDVLRKAVDAGVEVAPQRPCGGHVGARRTAEPEVDAAGMQGGERPELLGDHQRRVVGQHDAARADADRRGSRRDMGDDHRGRRAGDARHVVMLGEPVALVAEALGVAGEVERVPERLRDIAAFGDRRQVENGKRSHGSCLAKWPVMQDAYRSTAVRSQLTDAAPRAEHPCGSRSRFGFLGAYACAWAPSTASLPAVSRRTIGATLVP